MAKYVDSLTGHLISTFLADVDHAGIPLNGDRGPEAPRIVGSDRRRHLQLSAFSNLDIDLLHARRLGGSHSPGLVVSAVGSVEPDRRTSSSGLPAHFKRALARCIDQTPRGSILGVEYPTLPQIWICLVSGARDHCTLVPQYLFPCGIGDGIQLELRTLSRGFDLVEDEGLSCAGP